MIQYQERLLRLLKMMNELEFARLSTIARKRQRLETARKQFMRELSQSPELGGEMLNSIQMVLNENWRRYVDSKIREKTFELARLAAEEQEQVLRTRRSFGREKAMSMLIDRSKIARVKPPN